MNYPDPKDKYIENVLEKADIHAARERHLYLPGVRASFDLGLTVDECVAQINKSKKIGHWPA
jgi:hypothetical protein